MSAKYIHTIADEKPELHKQLGCMNGLFQIFNRQHFGAGRRRITNQSKKRLASGKRSNSEKEPNHTTKKSTEKILNDGVKERDRTSVESSRNSFSSSSCSSTFTSNDSIKLSQPDTSVLGHSPLSKTPSQVPKEQPNIYLDSSQGSPDIRNIVKNSIQRETCDLSIKTKAKPEGKTRVLKHIDSPRPQPVSPRVSKERNSTVPPKEAPRFSYDERESRDKWKSVGKVRELPRYSLDSRESSIRKAAFPEDLQQRSDQRLSSVVAKLMGLEAFPNPKETKNLDPISRKLDEKLDKQNSNSPRITPKDTPSPKFRNINSSPKPNARFPLEPAPWKPTNGNQDSQPLYPSVYGQMENRLMDLEFKKSGKDLRALKQILGAMQKAQESIEDKKDDIVTPTIKKCGSPKKSEASISVPRSPKALQRPKISSSEGVPRLRKLRTRDHSEAKKDMIPRKNQFRESPGQSPKLMDKRSSVATYRSKQTSVSPRLGKQSEASPPRKSVKQNDTDTLSPSRKLKPKSRVLKNHDDDRLSEISSEARCFSVCSESNRSIASQNDEVTSNYRSEVTGGLDEFKQKLGTTSATFEQPSPISVLDTSFYAEGSPSPVKKISSAFTDPDNLSSDETVFNPLDLVNFLNISKPDSVPEFDEKLENLEHLNDEADAAALCDSTDPTRRYVCEILSASGLLKDLEPSSAFTQLNESKGLINPHLFQILEQAKSKIEVQEDEHNDKKINQSRLHEKIFRKLIFDTTDEILVKILISSGFSEPWVSPNKLGFKSLTGKKLLEKICSRMNDLEADFECNLLNNDEANPLEVSGVVLDIERMIFKDLISEIVSGEAGLPSCLNRPRRQLFTN